jgi:hypothetical protein
MARNLPGAIALLLATMVAYLVWERSQHSVESAQAAFEHAEPDWNWEGWRKDGLLECQGDSRLRICTVLIWNYENPVTSAQATLAREAAFACSPETCAWVIEP